MTAFFLTYLEYLPDWGPRLVDGAIVTASLSLVGFALALCLGALLVAMQRSGSGLLAVLANAYVQFVRTVPLLALLLALYFALPSLGVTLSGYWAGALGLGLHGSAYVAEILRGGLTAIHRGQREAALAVGLSPWKVFAHVVFPRRCASCCRPCSTPTWPC